MGLIEEGVLIQALSKQLGLPSVDLDKWVDIPSPVLEILDGDAAQRLSSVPFRLEGRFVDIAMGDPMNPNALDELQILTQLNVRPYIAGPKSIERALSRHYQKGAGLLDMSVKYADQPSGKMELVHGTLTEQSEAIIQPAVSKDPRFELSPTGGVPPVGLARARTPTGETPEVRVLQQRISRLEQLVTRDEGVLRKLLSLLIEKGVATRDEIAEWIK